MIPIYYNGIFTKPSEKFQNVTYRNEIIDYILLNFGSKI